MISVEEAFALLKEHNSKLPVKKVKVADALGGVLARDIIAPIDRPSFNQSAMDGYALNYASEIDVYRIIDEVQAGAQKQPVLKSGEGVRIFTGAQVPDTATLIAQQEIVETENDLIRLTAPVHAGMHIRIKGEQIQEGTSVLPVGTVINPAGIGFLSGLGITEVEIIPQPEIGLITTGNELVKPGNPLPKGQIYESNSFMLKAAFEAHGYKLSACTSVPDNYEATKQYILDELKQRDVLLLTGGISVGDYDYVGKALEEIGTETIFYKIRQKPGKPIFVGKWKEKWVMALPGNPAAALTCFYIYVLPVLRQVQGKGFKGLKEAKLPLAEAYVKKGDRAVFLKARIEQKQVTVLDMQSSAMLRSFAQANALVYVPADKAQVEKGELVKVYRL